MKAISLLRDEKKTDALRISGIEEVGDIAWGTHLCQFYETKEDLLDILVPYFAEGLKNNEFCMWVTLPSLGVDEAKTALEKVIPELEQYMKKGQIEILSYKDWYLLGGRFDANRVLEGWLQKEKAALKRGFDGIRVTGDTSWIERSSWKSFVDYEAVVNNMIVEHRIIAVCTYSLSKVTGRDVADVIRNHESVLIRKGRTWILIEDVIKRRFVEKKAAESLRMLEKVFQASPDAITVTDLSGNIVECNRATLDLHGYSSKEELIGRNSFELIASKDHKRAMENLKKTLERGLVKGVEYTFVTKDGREFPAELSASVIEDSSGRTTGFMAITRDITERKEAEEKYRSIVDMAPDVIVTADVKGVITSFNTAGERISGYSKDEVVGKPFWKIGHIPARDIPKYLKMLHSALRGELLKRFEATWYHKNGTRRICEIHPAVIKRNGKIAGFQAIIRDITERKMAEEKLRLSEERFRNLFENARDVIVTFDLKGNVTSINRRVEEHGFKKDKIIGKNMLKFVSKKYWPRLLKELAKLARGNPVEGDIELVTPKGKRIAEYRSNPIRRGTKVVGFQTILGDVTQRKEMERKLREYSQRLRELLETRTEQLKDTKEQLVKAERMATIGEVAAMVGHDLRNPLQAIVNAIHLTKRKIDSTPPQFRKLAEKMGIFELRDMIEEQIEYMNKIVSDLQDYARPLKPKFVPTKLHQLINETLSAMKVPETVKISIKVPNDFPPLMVDPALMKRVFTNLITNALQAMPEGGKLTITASRREETAFISVQDTGVGIQKEHLPKIFLPLFTTKAKGQGFGLPVCKRLVEAHDGTITVESQVGKGSTFTVKIPLRREVSQVGKK